jgi:hypothetical protein
MLNVCGVVGMKGGWGVGFDFFFLNFYMAMYQVERFGRHRPTQVSYRAHTRVARPTSSDLNCRDVCGAQPREFKMFQKEITET